MKFEFLAAETLKTTVFGMWRRVVWYILTLISLSSFITCYKPTRFEVITAAKICNLIFWIVTPLILADGYKYIGAIDCFHHRISVDNE
jgi:hypothetical protein